MIFNSLNHTCIILNYEAYRNFINLEERDENFQKFIDLGMYVDESLDETKQFLYHSRKLIEKHTNPFYRILTTTECNAKCFYCYEKGVLQQSMNKATADSIIKFIDKERQKDELVNIEWFGGEPLLNKEIIYYICERLENLGIEFVSKIITNGYLFDKSLIIEAKNKWNLRSVQITLDGTKDVYEKVKNFSIPGAFDRVMENIDVLLQMNVFVDIRLNYDKYNFENILQLISFLSDKYRGNSNVFVSARRLIYQDKNNDLMTTEDTDCIIINKLFESNLSVDILERLRPRYLVCPAYIFKHFVIMPNGDLYKCSKDITDSNEKVGDVFNGIQDIKEYVWCCPNISLQCLSCQVLPLCNFGCRHEELKNKKACMISLNYVKQILLCKLRNLIDRL